MEEKKYYCDGPDCKNEIAKPQMCCNSFDCGCMGRPIDPPFCSNKCYDAYTEASKLLKERSLFAKNFFKKKESPKTTELAYAVNGGRPVMFGVVDELSEAFRLLSPEQVDSIWNGAVSNKFFNKFKPVFLTGTKGESMGENIFKRIDEVADIAKWIISAHGTSDLKISDANKLSREDIINDHGGEKDTEGNLIPLDVFMIYYRNNKRKYVRSGVEEEVQINLSLSDMYSVAIGNLIELIAPIPNEKILVPKIVFEHIHPSDYTAGCDPIFLKEGNPIEGGGPLVFNTKYVDR